MSPHHDQQLIDQLQALLRVLPDCRPTGGGR
jgi:hypothetical protein